MSASDLPEKSLSTDIERSGEGETGEHVPEFPFDDDGILVTIERVAVLVMGSTLVPETRRTLGAWMRDAVNQGESVRIDLPRPGEAASGEIKLRPGSRKISAFACGDTISKPN